MLHFEVRLEKPLPLHAAVDVSGGWLGLLGHSGTGKSTLLRTLAGLHHGHCRLVLDGETLDAEARARQVSLVCQDPPLVPHWSVATHIHRLLKFRPVEVRYSDEVLQALEISPLLKRRPHQLSGGERRRVALALALLRKPRLLLLDEPFAALDDAGRQRLYPRLQSVTRRLGIAVILVAHQIHDVARLCDRAVVLEDGRITWSGGLVAGLRYYQGRSAPCSVIEGTSVETGVREGLCAVAIGGQTVWCRSAAAPASGSRVRLLLHADDIGLSTTRLEGVSLMNQLQAHIDVLHTFEDGVLLDCSCEGQSILAGITRHSRERLGLQEGMEIQLIFKASAVEMFEYSDAGSTATHSSSMQANAFISEFSSTMSLEREYQ